MLFPVKGSFAIDGNQGASILAFFIMLMHRWKTGLFSPLTKIKNIANPGNASAGIR